MFAYDVIIRNGYVVLENEVVQTDIAITNGQIVQIAQNIQSEGAREISADGSYVFPGVIDVHSHFSEPGREHWEGFTTGSQMMAAGGTTTYFDMPLNGIPSTVTKEALLQKAMIGEQKSYVDFGLWGGLVPGNIEHLADLAQEGVIGFKAFISPTGNAEFENVDHITLLSGMQEIAGLGKVLALHAESAEITTWLTEQKRKTNELTADDYLATRPIVAEVEAVERAIHYATITGCSLHFVHISSPEALKVIDTAKAAGANITVETCAHYLLFNHDDLRQRGAVAKCAPPLREKAVQEELLQCLQAGKLDMISSDHSPCPYDMKTSDNIFDAWGGISGGQFTLLSVLEVALKNDIPFINVARWTATTPAERFQLKQKGKIAVGMDADIAIVAIKDFTVTEDYFFAKHKHSVYMGHTFPCQITHTLVRGELVFANHIIASEKPVGKWITMRENV